ncbi:MAG: DUF559 domain-containing protein [Desertifilum sp.]|nr:DUF559 domain-containing protein [Desertifilum sp.]
MSNLYWASAFSAIALAILFWSVWQQIRSFPQRQRTYQLKVRQFQSDRDLFEREMKALPKKVAQYKQDLTAFEEETKRINSARKQSRLFRILASTQSPNNRISQAKQGRSESLFKPYLERYFPDKIYTGRTLQNPKNDLRYPYTPDFIYIDPDSNLHIDIEIDEPYIYNSKKPYHYKDDESESIRNQFFNDCGWIVIRFCEEQVVRYPEDCCKFIAQVIANVLGKPIERSNSTLPKIPRWTFKEAKQMAKTNYRDTYLPRECSTQTPQRKRITRKRFTRRR